MDGRLVLWLVLVVIRIGWSLLPQSGYIHPDEFFQTVEVITGDVLNTQVTRTWEFNSSFPMRSVVIPKLIFWPTFQLLKLLNDSGSITLTGWTLLSSTRFIMAVLSLWTDFCIYRMVKFMKGDYSKGLILVASSYVTLTFQCHTFTNSFETLLFSSLMFIISSSTVCLRRTSGNKTTKKKSKLVISKKEDDKIVMHSKDIEEKIGVPYFSCIALGVVSVAGVFNRPTFVIFSFLPTLWWFMLITMHFKSIKDIALPTFFITSAAAVTCAIFCVIDSLYFNNVSAYDILSSLNYCLPFRLSLSSFYCLRNVVAKYAIFTPWNFVQYNTKGDNLAEHGLHPFYLHFCVNMPLLFGPLFYHFLKSLSAGFNDLLGCLNSMFSMDSKRSKTTKTDELPLVLPLTAFTLIPVLIFSLFPHQEPRFLIPLLPLMIIIATLSMKSFNMIFITSFVIFNIVLTIIFGFLHQGGITPCILKLQSSYNTNQIKEDSDIAYHFIFSRTYMPPQFPLLIQSSKVKVWDMKGGNFSTISATIHNIQNSDDTNTKSRIFLITPGIVYKDLPGNKFNITLADRFYPHLSFEDPPKLTLSKKLGIFFRFKEMYYQLFLLLLEIQ